MLTEDLRERGTRRPPRGRPRDPSVEPRVYEAARASVGELGVAGASLSAIADRAEVGKATVRRRWSSLGDLLVGAAQDLRESLHLPPAGPVRTRLVRALEDDRAVLIDGPHAPFLRCLLFAGTDYPAVGEAMREGVLDPRATRLAQILAAGRSTGEIAPGRDVDAAADTLMSAHILAMVVARPRESAHAVEHWVESVCAALAPRPAGWIAGTA